MIASAVIFVFLGVASTAVATLSYAISSRRLPPLTTMIRLVTPVFAAVYAALALGELPWIWVLPGDCLILGGVLLLIVNRP